MIKIPECPICGGKDIVEKEVEIPIADRHVRSIKVNGAECRGCKEKFYDTESMKIAEQFQKMLDELAVTKGA